MNDLIVSFRDDMLESGCQIEQDRLKQLLLNFIKLNNLSSNDLYTIDNLVNKIRDKSLLNPFLTLFSNEILLEIIIC